MKGSSWSPIKWTTYQGLGYQKTTETPETIRHPSRNSLHSGQLLSIFSPGHHFLWVIFRLSRPHRAVRWLVLRSFLLGEAPSNPSTTVPQDSGRFSGVRPATALPASSVRRTDSAASNANEPENGAPSSRSLHRPSSVSASAARRSRFAWNPPPRDTSAVISVTPVSLATEKETILTQRGRWI